MLTVPVESHEHGIEGTQGAPRSAIQFQVDDRIRSRVTRHELGLYRHPSCPQAGLRMVWTLPTRFLDSADGVRAYPLDSTDETSS